MIFYLTNEILLLKEHDAGSHCPFLITVEPSGLTRQERRTSLSDESKKQNADKRKAEQRAKKAMGKAKAGS